MTQQQFTFEPTAATPDPEVGRPAPRIDSREVAAPGRPVDEGSRLPVGAPMAGRVRTSQSTTSDLTVSLEDRASSSIRTAIYVRNPRARRYVVRVRPDGVVRVTIPNRGSKRQAIEFAEQQQAWIANELARAERERAEPRDVIAPETIEALKAQAKRELPPRLLTLAAQFDLTVSRITIRNQRWRWGSCSRAGHISLNWRLVVMPDWVRDYVLIHELMHLRRMDHSPKFWAHVAGACPDYEAARTWLRAFKTFPPHA